MRLRYIGNKPSEISYDRCASGDVAVYLDGTRVGTITKVSNGWQYVTTRGDRGEIMATVRDVMRSLDTE